MPRGEILAFRVVRTAAAGFTKNEQRLETIIDHPVHRLSQHIIFPKQRPCRGATLCYEGFEAPLPVIKLPDGRTLTLILERVFAPQVGIPQVFSNGAGRRDPVPPGFPGA